MARALGRPVGLIKLAVGGTSLEQHWNPTAIVKEKGIGTMLQRLVQYLQSVRKANPDIRIAGMIWMQGEADARYHAKTMEQYRDKLEALVDAYRRESGQDAMPFVCGRVNPPNWPYQKNVREAQESAQRANYAWIDCDDLGMHDDKLHFNTAGQIELGKRFAEAMVKLINSKNAGR
jgi:lysophospholipase L1-like esterase